MRVAYAVAEPTDPAPTMVTFAFSIAAISHIVAGLRSLRNPWPQGASSRDRNGSIAGVEREKRHGIEVRSRGWFVSECASFDLVAFSKISIFRRPVSDQ